MSGFFGVYVSGNNFEAQISIGNGKQKSIGSFDTVEQATKAYDTEAIRLRKPLSKLNYPEKAPVGYTPMQQPLMATNTVGYRGVYKVEKKFRTQIRIGGKRTSIGLFDTVKEAAIAFDRAVLKANQSTTLLNFPGMVHNLDVEQKRKKQKVRSTTGYRGVSKVPCGRFRASIYDGKQIGIGTFDTALSAALAYDQAAIKRGKKTHTLNFPMDQKEKKEKKKQKEKKKLKKKEKKEKMEKMEKMEKKKTKKKELTLQEYKEMLQA